MVVSINGKKVMAVLVVLVVLQLTMTVLLCMKTFGASNVALYDFTVVIDAGHGGIDGGVVGANGSKESDLNLLYAKELGAVFESCGFNVVQTRSNKNGLYGLPTKGFKMRDMEKRREIIENADADLVISVHMNRYSDSKRSGPQVFFQKGSDCGKLLGESVQKSLNNFTGNKHQALSGDFYICRCTDVPSVIVECGFLSNPEEENLLNDKDYRADLMQKVYSGVMLYLYNS